MEQNHSDQGQEQQESGIETILRKLAQYSCHVSVHPTTRTNSTAEVGSSSTESNMCPEPCSREDPSTNVGRVIKSIQEQAALLATLTQSAPVQQKDHSCTACDEHTKYADELNIQIGSLRQGWIEGESRHVQLSLELQEMRHVVEACDITFRELRQSKDGFLGNGLPLSQIAVDVIASYCDERRKQYWDENRASMERKSSKMKKKAREMLQSNQVFHKFAQSFNSELYRYSLWLDVRHRSLQDNYQRVCQILKEQGAEPELLYDDYEVLSESQTAYKEAWMSRLEAAQKAREAAQLYGLSNPFEGMDEA